MHKRPRKRSVPATWRVAVIDALTVSDVNGIDNEEKTALFYAIFDANENMVKKLIDAGVDVNVTDKNGGTPLFHAVWKKNEILVEALIDAGADVNVADNDKKTALLHAVCDDNEPMVKKLIDACADVNVTDTDGKTALFHAVGKKNKAMVKTLIDTDADVNVTDVDGQTALFHAVRDDNEAMVKTLIDTDADVNVTDKDGKTALFHAVRPTSETMVKTLLDAGVDVNVTDNDGQTALFHAVRDDNETMVKTLIYAGADDLFLNDNCTVLTYFIEKYFFDLTEKVFEIKDALNLLIKERKSVENKTIFRAIVSVAFSKILLSKSKSRYVSSLSGVLNLSINYTSKLGFYGKRKDIITILRMLKSACNNVQLIESGYACSILTRLHKLGANPNTIDSDGNTALHYAIQLSNNGISQDRVMEICQQLMKCNVSFNIKNHEKETPLLYGLSRIVQKISRGDECSAIRLKILTSVCQFLVKHGSSVEEKTRSGESVLHLTLKILKESFLKHDNEFRNDILIGVTCLSKVLVIAYREKQISVSSKDSSGNTPLHLWATLHLAKGQDYSRTITGDYTFKDLLLTILNVLLENTAQLNLRNENEETPLHLCKTWTAVKLLMDAGANPNDLDLSERSPLLVAAKNKTFLCNKDSFYPDVLLEPQEFWRTVFKRGLDPLTVDKHGESVLSVLMESESHNLATALAKTACEHGSFQRSRDLMLTFLTTICKDKSINALWKVDIVEMILNSTEHPVNGNNEDSPLHFCCRNIIETTKGLSVEEIKKNVHWKIAVQLLLYGADRGIPDVTGKTCLALIDAYPELKDLLKDPKNYPLLITKWEPVSKNYERYLFKVAMHFESMHVDQYWYHKQHLRSGSFGAVFAGINEKDGREVAIKRIETFRMQRPEDKREIANLAQLADCEHVVSYFRFFEDGEFSYIVLELMEGNLCEFLDNPTTKETRTQLCKDVVTGLRFIHGKSILHRDLKPTNILFKVNPKLCLKIADFGLSRRIDSTGSTSVCGSNVGTRCWIAPEVLNTTSNHSKSSDVFACGLVLHYILSGKKHPFDPPHGASMLHETELNLLNGNMEGWDNSLCPEATHLIKKMLESDQTGRPSADNALTHPLFWSKDKKIGILKAVGNQQPEFTCPRAKRPLPSRDAVENDLEAAFGIIIKFPKWDDPRNVHMPVIYSEMTRRPRRSYDTSSVVELVRFIRNAYEHVAEISQPKLLLEDYVFLDYFPNLVMEVFKAVTTHRWDKTRDEIIRAMK